MPNVPSLPPEMQQAAGVSPTNPMNFLMAAAEAHSAGDFQSAPIPKGKAFDTGKVSGKRHRMKVIK